MKRDRGADRGKRKRPKIKLERDAIIDYKDIELLRNFVTERGKLRGRHATGLSRRHQAQAARAVKRARELALLPYVTERTERS
ncbi:MAG: 30S ribosomal protein S18 [Thermoleophilaceae bacterium]|nr:30S ribosomal protein S18 [Thermoleophilaceae bacterium]